MLYIYRYFIIYYIYINTYMMLYFLIFRFYLYIICMYVCANILCCAVIEYIYTILCYFILFFIAGGYILTSRWVLKWKSHALSRYEQETLLFEGSQHYSRGKVRLCLQAWIAFGAKRRSQKKQLQSSSRRESISYNWYKDKNLKSLQHISSIEKEKERRGLLLSSASKDYSTPKKMMVFEAVEPQKTAASPHTQRGQQRGKRLSILFQRLSSSHSHSREGGVDLADDDGDDGDDDGDGSVNENRENQGNNNNNAAAAAAAAEVALGDWMQLAGGGSQECDSDLLAEDSEEESVTRRRVAARLLQFAFRSWTFLFHSHVHWKQYRKYMVMQSFYRRLVAKTVTVKLLAVATSAFKDTSTRRALKRWFVVCQLYKRKRKKQQQQEEELQEEEQQEEEDAVAREVESGSPRDLVSSNIFGLEHAEPPSSSSSSASSSRRWQQQRQQVPPKHRPPVPPPSSPPPSAPAGGSLRLLPPKHPPSASTRRREALI
jgi:hypothetical protein